MDGGHLAMPDSEILMNDLHHRGQTIGGAGRSSQLMTSRIIAVLIHTHHHIQHIIGHYRS